MPRARRRDTASSRGRQCAVLADLLAHASPASGQLPVATLSSSLNRIEDYCSFGTPTAMPTDTATAARPPRRCRRPVSTSEPC